jgi:hypothetical protein
MSAAAALALLRFVGVLRITANTALSLRNLQGRALIQISVKPEVVGYGGFVAQIGLCRIHCVNPA